MIRFFLLVAAMFALAMPVRGQTLVAAASDLKFVLEKLALRYEKNTGDKVRLVFGSSGNLSTQILNGAPFHIFMSADESFADRVVEKGLTLDAGRVYAKGRLALFVLSASKLILDPNLDGLESTLKDANAPIKKFAIANPEHAPYGLRARQALEHRKLWELLQAKLVLGENVTQAASFVSTGNAQVGIVAYSLASVPPLSEQGRFVVIPEAWHQSLRQKMVIMKSADAKAQQFYRYLQSEEALEVFKNNGFPEVIGPALK